MLARLQEYCQKAFASDGGARVSDVVALEAGWEHDMHAFALERGPAGTACRREELILRIYPGDDAAAKAAAEFRGMTKLRAAGYPVPRVLVLECDDSPFGKPFTIMERIDGRDLWPLLFDAPDSARRGELLTLFCELLVRLHRLEWRPFADDETLRVCDDPYCFVDRALAGARGGIEALDLPGFLPLVDWFEARRDRVPCPRPSVGHGDYHPKNVLIQGDGSAVVIDWTGLHVGDPRHDLAQATLLAGTHAGPEWRGRIRREYERVAGEELEEMEFFDAGACAGRLITFAAAYTSSHVNGGSWSIPAAAYSAGW